MLPLHKGFGKRDENRQRKMLDEHHRGLWERHGRKIRKTERNNRALGKSTVNYCVVGILVVKKCGGLSAVQVVTQPAVCHELVPREYDYTPNQKLREIKRCENGAVVRSILINTVCDNKF